MMRMLSAKVELVEGADSVCTHSRGIKNQGCSCFRSSAIQVLLSLPLFMSLVKNLRKTLKSITKESAKEGGYIYWYEIVSILSQFIVDLGDLQHMPSKNAHIHANEYIPTLLVAFQGRPGSGNVVKNGKATQEDAMEFITFVFDMLHEEALALNKYFSAANSKGVDLVGVNLEDAKEDNVIDIVYVRERD